MDGCLLLYCRALSRHTLPLSVWHLHPRICPADMNVKWLTLGIGPRAFESSGRDGRIAKNGYLQVLYFGAFIFYRLRHFHEPGLVLNLAVELRIHDFVG